MKSIYKAANSILKNEIDQDEIYQVASSIVSLDSVFQNCCVLSIYCIAMWNLFLGNECQARCFKATAVGHGRRLPRRSGIWAGPWRMVDLPPNKRAFQAEGKGYAQTRRSLFRGGMSSVIGSQVPGEERLQMCSGRQVELINEPLESTYVGASALPRNSISLVMGLALGIRISNKLPWQWGAGRRCDTTSSRF